MSAAHYIPVFSVKMIHYIPTKTILELVQVLRQLRRVNARKSSNRAPQKQVQADPKRKRNVEIVLQSFVDDVSWIPHLSSPIDISDSALFAACSLLSSRQRHIIVPI
jgi:hypothetical protein